MQNNPPQPCLPRSECWCEQRPNHPQCQDSVPINDYTPLFILVGLLYGMYIVFKKHKQLIIDKIV